MAVSLSAALTTLAIALLWQPLDVNTDIVGYPIFADFNVQNYFTAYYLVVGMFPILAVLLFEGLTRLAPRVGLAAPPPRGEIRARPARRPEGEWIDSDPPLTTLPNAKRHFVSAGRIGLVAAVIGLEAAILMDAVAAGLALGLIAYPLAVLAAATAVRKWGRGNLSFAARLAAVNAVGVPLTVAGLWAVSSVTEVTILSNGSSDSQSWFPVWLALPVAAAFVGAVVIALRHCGSADGIFRIERRAVILIAAPVGLFLLLAGLYGAVGQIDMFHTGELVAAARLVGDGWMPWRDLVLTHGLLEDVIQPAIGIGVFEDSIWGYLAGNSMVVLPAYFVSVYFLFAYLFGRNWLFLLFVVLVVLGTSLAPAHFRLILWPPILLLLAASLSRATLPRATGLGLLTVVQVVVTPEAAPALPAVLITLALYEWYESRSGVSVGQRFRRTLLFAAATVLVVASFAAYLAVVGALDDYAYISTALARGHALTGGFPPTHIDAVSLHYLFIALAPLVALLISLAYAAARLRLRRGFYIEDWVMAAAVLFTAVYYAKFLARMSVSHAAQSYAAALPLVLFVLYRLVSAVERWIRDRWPANLTLKATAHPVSLVLVVLVIALGWAQLSDRVTRAPSSFRPEVAAPPQYKRVGYAVEPFDPVMYRDLKRVIDTYLEPEDRFFDFTNSPALYFYLMDREPSTRYFHVSGLALRANTQDDLIDRLRSSRPKLIAFDNFLVGLPNFDGIPTNVRLYNVSHWILDHYRPLLTTHTTTFYARRDQPPPPDDLKLAEGPLIEEPEFSTQPCSWGYVPNFLNSSAQPQPGAKAARARFVGVTRPQTTIVGWAGDAQAGKPAREVIATVGEQIVARDVPRITREDLTADLPSGFARSGFRLRISARFSDLSELRLFGIAADGSASELPRGTDAPAGGMVRLGARTVRLEPTAVAGHIDGAFQDPRLQIERPPGSSWADYRWLEITPGDGGFQDGAFTVFDQHGNPVPGSREISFQTLESSPHPYVISVGSCPQWHGYRDRRLFLDLPPGQDIAGIRLIR